ncbi:MAG: hypothetical protein R3E66_10755 [bacterium]
MRKVAAMLVLMQLGCGSIETEPRLDANGTPIPEPPAGEDWLVVRSMAPDGDVIPGRPELIITLSDYVSPQSLLGFDAVVLTSGGKRMGGLVTWSNAEKALRWRPNGTLIDGLDYTLQLNDSRLQSVVGSPLFPPLRRTWRVDTSLPNAPEGTVEHVRYADVERLLDRQCWSCHQDPQWRLNPLTRTSMVGQRAAEVETFLVVPFAPSESYLLQKVLPDHPLIRWDQQPPAWSGAAPLTTAQIQLIEQWIAQGAL